MLGDLVEVSDNVYAYVQGRGEWFVSNSGLIVGDKYAVLVDSLSNEKRTLEMIERVGEVTNKPIKILVNTHGHPDHVWTNHMFDAIAVCQENARNETKTALVDLYKFLFPDLDFSGAKITLQDVTFEKSLKIDIGKEIKLVHPGVAHTTGDCYVYLPSEKVVFCGDLLFSKPCTPLALGGSVRGFVKALDELLGLDADVYIPGHGGVSGKEEVLAAKEYFEHVFDESEKRKREGMDWYDAALDIDLGKFKHWNEKERVFGNVARIYAELEGRDIPFQELVEIAKKMLEFRGE